MKGIILAGGNGTRLYPLTRGVCKQLLPVYDKPMIYYPLSVLMLSGIREILIISTPSDIPRFHDMFSDGTEFGLHISYIVQPSPNGIAEAFLLGKDFIGTSPVCLILGDNIFFGHNIGELLCNTATNISLYGGATVFGYYVNDPKRYGIVEFDQDGAVLSIEEKPENPKSNYAITGLYFYDNSVVSFAQALTPSLRGELEITDINRKYLTEKKLNVELMGRGYAWLDTGTHESLLEASGFIATIEKRQGLKVACIEEIAYQLGYIDHRTLLIASEKYKKSSYGDYLKKVASQETMSSLRILT